MSGVLIHIGYPKSGSTYLQRWFELHPSFFWKHRGVTGFFISHDISRYAEKHNSLHSYFVLSCEELSSWKGDVDIVGMKDTVMYDVRQYQNNLAHTLKRIYPQAKILIVTRGYTTFFHSMYNELRMGGGVLSYPELHEKYIEFFKTTYDYSYVVNLYRTVFGHENVIVLPFEMLHDNPSSFTGIIEEALGIERAFTIGRDKVNASLDQKTLTAYRTVSNLVYEGIKPLPYNMKRWLYWSYIQWIKKKKPNPFLHFIGKFMQAEDLSAVQQTVEAMRGRAEILRDEPLYQPYLKEYLL